MKGMNPKMKLTAREILKLYKKEYKPKPVIGVSDERGSEKKETDQQANDQNDRKTATYHRGQNTKSNTKPPEPRGLRRTREKQAVVCEMPKA